MTPHPQPIKFWITEHQLDQIYDVAFDRADWGESPHDNKPLNKLCDEITSQKEGAVLAAIILWRRKRENEKWDAEQAWTDENEYLAKLQQTKERGDR